ncbi:hypothetical protein [Terrimonas alba]|uniref:hypothetical protein n=1 Tax=Terrimonas alba TaxID=3349636 RepID=UPI0035F3CB1E
MQSLSLIKELTQTQPELVDYASTLLEKFAQKQPQGENIIESYKIVVTPLHDYIITKAKQHPKITELLFLVQDLFNEYNGIELSAAHNAEDYRDYGKRLEKTAEDLIESSKQLRKDFSSKM